MAQISRQHFKETSQGSAAQNAEAALASLIVEQIGAGIKARGRASLVLSGGRTPGRLMPLITAAEIDWKKVSITFTDERWVPVDDPASTEGALRAMMAGTAMSDAAFFGFYRDDMELEEAPSRLAPAFRQAFPDPFDMVFLGMGEDGHTASLFPGRPWAKQCDSSDKIPFVVDRAPPVLPARISLCPNALLNAHVIGMIAAGEVKGEVLDKALSEQNEDSLPIAILGRGSSAKIELFIL